jgi:glutamate N-acetyltransferase/amino-acid N-acetyltransferase
MTAAVASHLGCEEHAILVCSTGVIGRRLPRPPLEAGIPKAVQSLAATPEAFLDAARGMMTTDTVPKLKTRSVEVAGRIVRVCGLAKGAAMVAPRLGTMLSVIVTDAPLGPVEADTLLRHAVDRSFNCISIDGHMSTSDTVILLARSAQGMAALSAHERTRLQQSLDEVATELAQAIIRDAEGASHEISIDVRGLRSRSDALRIARSVADSALVKTAVAGGDPNWGRIVSAAGYAGVPFEERELTLRVNDTLLYSAGAPVAFDAAEISAGLRSNRRVHIELDFGQGHEQARFWTSDLTAEYVRLNSEYTT